MRKLFLIFPKGETLSHFLSWSHYFEILKSDSDLEIGFYAKQCEKEKWSVRELKRLMKCMLFYRLAVSTDKEGILKLVNHGHHVQQPEDLFTEGDNEPIGILLGAYKDQVLVEYATGSITNKVLLAKYQLFLPDKAQLQKSLNDLLEVAN